MGLMKATAHHLETRVPPQNIDAEKSVLGAILIDREGINKVVDFLRPDDFYHRGHQIIYEAMISLFENREPIDLLSLSNRLAELGHLDEVGGMSYLTTLTNTVPSSAHIASYGKIVQRKKMLRGLIDAANHIMTLGHEERDDIDSLLDEAEQRLFSVSQHSLTKTFAPLGSALEEAMERITNQDAGMLRGQKTDYKAMDDLLGGLQKSDLIVLAARPSVGKTAFTVNLALKVAKQGVPVGVFSLEMSSDQVVDRLISAESGVSLWKLRTGKLSHQEDSNDFLRITMACDELKNIPIFIDDTPALNILQMRAMARRLKSEKGLGLLVVDYLQLMASRKNYDSAVQQVTEISRGLKGLAKELNIPIIAISQLSRAVEQREGHKPKLSDLRDSGCLTGDTLITRADTGERVKIQDLVGMTDIPIISLDESYKLRESKISKVFSSGIKEIFELKTRSGRKIKVSANHPFLTIAGWKRVDELSLGTRVALPRELKLFGTKNLKDSEIILLAHLIGDGCVLPTQPIHYKSADERNLDIVEQSAQELFNIKPRRVGQENWWHTYLPSPYRLTRNVKHPITKWYQSLDIEPVRSYEKKVPAAVFSQTEDKIKLFLNHLWATDGNISWKILDNRSPSAAIYYSSSSEQLAFDVQHLLLKLGIWSTVSKIDQKNGRPNYHVSIQSLPNQLNFLEKVGCYGKRGEIIPELIKAIKSIKTNPNLDVIPKDIWRMLITEEKNKADMSWRYLASCMSVAYNGSALFARGVSRDRLSKIASVLSSEKLHHLAQSDVYWDELVSITPLGTEQVYDATVPGTHNFIANDFIVHNSIEQDSDVVMFIHREDKSNPERAKSEGKVNIAQLIVAKHRNGPTGEIEFYVNPNSLQFSEIDRSHAGEYIA